MKPWRRLVSGEATLRHGAVRNLTSGEIVLARRVFGDAIDYPRVRLRHAKWWPFQPRGHIMAPDGDIWFHPFGTAWREDFAQASLPMQGLFVHELTHVWQAQRGGRWFLPLMRHPFCRYRYELKPGKPFAAYGLEQQAEIVRHGYLARAKGSAPPPICLPFTRA